MKQILLTVSLFVFTCQILTASVDITGTFDFCPAPSGGQNYTVEVSNQTGVAIEVTGGVISSDPATYGVTNAQSCTFGALAVSVTRDSDTVIKVVSADGSCDYDIVFVVTWTASASTKKIEAQRFPI